ncbi:uncharacterized protein LOC106176935 [Lingula anatina]|uniref:Uncharacterized protein LOC106176935 n=1 Tax=Lingula anatina TaxID=7574 RepID=A0A1S3JX76_LINAN|nr:uncharacterized protein LOC106176935 [Lingula anatina]|eukprot:XP_013414978.2 uncharacterized protein LOC106176935 [Lingula anatina]
MAEADNSTSPGNRLQDTSLMKPAEDLGSSLSNNNHGNDSSVSRSMEDLVKELLNKHNQTVQSHHKEATQYKTEYENAVKMMERLKWKMSELYKSYKKQKLDNLLLQEKLVQVEHRFRNTKCSLCQKEIDSSEKEDKITSEQSDTSPQEEAGSRRAILKLRGQKRTRYKEDPQVDSKKMRPSIDDESSSQNATCINQSQKSLATAKKPTSLGATVGDILTKDLREGETQFLKTQKILAPETCAFDLIDPIDESFNEHISVKDIILKGPEEDETQRRKPQKVLAVETWPEETIPECSTLETSHNLDLSHDLENRKVIATETETEKKNFGDELGNTLESTALGSEEDVQMVAKHKRDRRGQKPEQSKSFHRLTDRTSPSEEGIQTLVTRVPETVNIEDQDGDDDVKSNPDNSQDGIAKDNGKNSTKCIYNEYTQQDATITNHCLTNEEDRYTKSSITRKTVKPINEVYEQKETQSHGYKMKRSDGDNLFDHSVVSPPSPPHASTPVEPRIHRKQYGGHPQNVFTSSPIGNSIVEGGLLSDLGINEEENGCRGEGKVSSASGHGNRSQINCNQGNQNQEIYNHGNELLSKRDEHNSKDKRQTVTENELESEKKSANSQRKAMRLVRHCSSNDEIDSEIPASPIFGKQNTTDGPDDVKSPALFDDDDDHGQVAVDQPHRQYGSPFTRGKKLSPGIEGYESEESPLMFKNIANLKRGWKPGQKKSKLPDGERTLSPPGGKTRLFIESGGYESEESPLMFKNIANLKRGWKPGQKKSKLPDGERTLSPPGGKTRLFIESGVSAPQSKSQQTLGPSRRFEGIDGEDDERTRPKAQEQNQEKFVKRRSKRLQMLEVPFSVSPPSSPNHMRKNQKKEERKLLRQSTLTQGFFSPKKIPVSSLANYNGGVLKSEAGKFEEEDLKKAILESLADAKKNEEEDDLDLALKLSLQESHRVESSSSVHVNKESSAVISNVGGDAEQDSPSAVIHKEVDENTPPREQFKKPRTPIGSPSAKQQCASKAHSPKSLRNQRHKSHATFDPDETCLPFLTQSPSVPMIYQNEGMDLNGSIDPSVRLSEYDIESQDETFCDDPQQEMSRSRSGMSSNIALGSRSHNITDANASLDTSETLLNCNRGAGAVPIPDLEEESQEIDCTHRSVTFGKVDKHIRKGEESQMISNREKDDIETQQHQDEEPNLQRNIKSKEMISKREGVFNKGKCPRYHSDNDGDVTFNAALDLVHSEMDEDLMMEKDVSDSQPQDANLLDDSFDRVPKAEGPAYKYVDVVRKRDDRRKLEAFDCPECEEYFKDMNLTAEEKRERAKQCSRHRAKYVPPSTPPHFWDIGFPDTQECKERGYIREATQRGPSAYRRRKPLKQIFDS